MLGFTVCIFEYLYIWIVLWNFLCPYLLRIHRKFHALFVAISDLVYKFKNIVTQNGVKNNILSVIYMHI